VYGYNPAIPGYGYTTPGSGLGYAPYSAGYSLPAYSAYASSFYPRYTAPYNPSQTSGTGTLPSRGLTSGAGAQDRADVNLPAEVVVKVPADAELWFEGKKVSNTGTSRSFRTPPLEQGHKYSYEVRARWKEGGKPVEKTRKVIVKAGERSTLDFLEDTDSSG